MRSKPSLVHNEKYAKEFLVQLYALDKKESRYAFCTLAFFRFSLGFLFYRRFLTCRTPVRLTLVSRRFLRQLNPPRRIDLGITE